MTIIPGFRYEAQWNPDYANPTVPQNRFPLATSIPDDTRMFAPRLGFAWDIGNGGKTVLRGGGGLFYATTYMSIFAQSILFNGGNPEKAFSIVVNNPAQLANAFQSIGVNLATAPLDKLPVFTTTQAYELFGAQAPPNANNIAPYYFDPKFKNPRSAQFQVGIEREIVRGILANVTYSQLNTVQVARQRDINPSGFTMDAEVYTDARVAAALSQKMVAVRIHFDIQTDLVRQYKVEAIPNIVFTDSYGTELLRHRGIIEADDLAAVIEALPSDVSEFNRLDDILRKDKNNFSLLQGMASRLRVAGLYQSSNEFYRKAADRNEAKKNSALREALLLEMGLNFLDLRDGKQAAAVFERCLKEFPTSQNRQRFMSELARARQLLSEV